jgi:hypothetical protein
MKRPLCPSCASLAQLYDGELEAAREPGVLAHLAICATCRRELGDWMQVDAAVSRATQVRKRRRWLAGGAVSLLLAAAMTLLLLRARTDDLPDVRGARLPAGASHDWSTLTVAAETVVPAALDARLAWSDVAAPQALPEDGADRFLAALRDALRLARWPTRGKRWVESVLVGETR